jgi:hypothetical protein
MLKTPAKRALRPLFDEAPASNVSFIAIDTWDMQRIILYWPATQITINRMET